MKLRLYILLFSVAVYILTALASVIAYIGTPMVRFWLIVAYVFACPLVFAFAFNFLIGDGKLSGKQALLLSFSVIIISVTVTHSVWIVVTPKWSFSVSTDKSTYSLGEDVQIMVSLENLGFVPHSFKSSISEPVVISITTQRVGEVWLSPYHFNMTEFTVPAHQFLERTFIWNQTNIYNQEEKIERGKYYIRALIESATSDMLGWDPIFFAGTSITIMST